MRTPLTIACAAALACVALACIALTRPSIPHARSAGPVDRAYLPLSAARARLDRLPRPATAVAPRTPRPTRTATATRSPEPSPTPMNCSRPWRLTLRVIAEGGAGDAPCDGLPADGDPAALRACALPSLVVEVRAPGRFRGGGALLWSGALDGAPSATAIERTAELCVPPPYEVGLRRDPDGPALPDACARLCSRTPWLRTVDQADFDRGEPGAPQGEGRAAALGWSLDRSLPRAASQGAPLAYLPALDAASAAAACAPRVVVQNVGDEANKVALILWSASMPSSACGQAAAGPVKVECSGLLKPGTNWTFGAPQLPAGVGAGYVVSLNNRDLVRDGLDIAVESTFGEYVCELLFFRAVGDAADEARFRDAFRHGAAYHDVPLDRAHGGPIAVTVERACPAGDPAAPSTSDGAAYTAPSAADVDVATPRQAVDGARDATPYRYALPAIVADGHRTTILHVQNADVACNEADVFVVDAAGQAVPCTHLSLPPGEARAVDMAACLAAHPSAADGEGRTAGLAAASGPLAIAVDIVGIAPGWPVLAGYTAPSPARPPVLGAGVGTTLMAPLAFEPSADRATGAEIFVQNADAGRQADVQVQFFNGNSDAPAGSERTMTLPPAGRASFVVPPSDAGALDVRITSRSDPASPDPASPDAPPALAAVVVHGRSASGAYTPTAPLAWSAADAFAAALDPRSGTRADAVRAARLAIPSTIREKGPTTDGPGRASRIALINRIDRPGYTDVVVYLYDHNWLLDYVCQKLNERQVEYIDLDTWGYMNRGYRGSALVSAWFWEHDVFDARGEFVANLVDIAAAYGGAGPEPSDGRSWTSALPFSADFALASDAIVPDVCAPLGESRPPLR